jgi:methionyl-tRNA formyltransferase
MNEISNQKIRIVFFGSAEFSIPSLDFLFNPPFDIVAIVTQPNKASGRGKKVLTNTINQWAINHNINVFQPERLSDNTFSRNLAELRADFFVVVAYGKILPQFLLDLPKFGAVNVHGSLLPRYRGASPVQSAILSGDNFTGVTIMKMDKGMDTGLILDQKEIEILPTATAGSLSEKIAMLGASLLVRTLSDLFLGKITPIPQSLNNISICKKISKDDARVNWNDSSQTIERLVRAFYPWPIAWTMLKNKLQSIRIHKAQLSDKETIGKRPGGVFIDSDNNFLVCCGDNKALHLITIQPQNKNIMSARDYLRGNNEILISGLV